MSPQKGKEEWFKQWFSSIYQTLYQHRHISQASQQVLSLLKHQNIPLHEPVLDVACGAGRHMMQFTQLHHRVFGIDLSIPLLKEAQSESLQIAQADMRALPFKDEHFHLVTSFFSSFGYFAAKKEDMVTMQEFRRLLKPNGYLYLDLINKPYVLKNLVPEDTQTLNGRHVHQKRHVEESVIIKDITITSEKGQVQNFQERLRLYAKEEMLDIADSHSLDVIHFFGTEKGEPYHQTASPRMAMLMQAR